MKKISMDFEIYEEELEIRWSDGFDHAISEVLKRLEEIKKDPNNSKYSFNDEVLSNWQKLSVELCSIINQLKKCRSPTN